MALSHRFGLIQCEGGKDDDDETSEELKFLQKLYRSSSFFKCSTPLSKKPFNSDRKQKNDMDDFGVDIIDPIWIVEFQAIMKKCKLRKTKVLDHSLALDELRANGHIIHKESSDKVDPESTISREISTAIFTTSSPIKSIRPSSKDRKEIHRAIEVTVNTTKITDANKMLREKDEIVIDRKDDFVQMVDNHSLLEEAKIPSSVNKIIEEKNEIVIVKRDDFVQMVDKHPLLEEAKQNSSGTHIKEHVDKSNQENQTDIQSAKQNGSTLSKVHSQKSREKKNTFKVIPSTCFPLDELLPKLPVGIKQTGTSPVFEEKSKPKISINAHNPVTTFNYEPQLITDFPDAVFHGEVYGSPIVNQSERIHSDEINGTLSEPCESTTCYGESIFESAEHVSANESNYVYNHGSLESFSFLRDGIHDGNTFVEQLQNALSHQIKSKIPASAKSDDRQSEELSMCSRSNSFAQETYGYNTEPSPSKPSDIEKFQKSLHDYYRDVERAKHHDFVSEKGDNIDDQSGELFQLFIKQCSELVKTSEDQKMLSSLVSLLRKESRNELHETGFTPPCPSDRSESSISSGRRDSLIDFKISDKDASLDMFEGRTLLKGGVQPRRIPKTNTSKSCMIRPKDPRPVSIMLSKTIPQPLPLPRFIHDLCDEQTIQRILTLDWDSKRIHIVNESIESKTIKKETIPFYNPSKDLRRYCKSSTSAKETNPEYTESPPDDIDESPTREDLLLDNGLDTTPVKDELKISKGNETAAIDVHVYGKMPNAHSLDASSKCCLQSERMKTPLKESILADKEMSEHVSVILEYGDNVKQTGYLSEQRKIAAAIGEEENYADLCKDDKITFEYSTLQLTSNDQGKLAKCNTSKGFHSMIKGLEESQTLVKSKYESNDSSKVEIRTDGSDQVSESKTLSIKGLKNGNESLKENIPKCNTQSEDRNSKHHGSNAHKTENQSRRNNANAEKAVLNKKDGAGFTRFSDPDSHRQTRKDQPLPVIVISDDDGEISNENKKPKVSSKSSASKSSSIKASQKIESSQDKIANKQKHKKVELKDEAANGNKGKRVSKHNQAEFKNESANGNKDKRVSKQKKVDLKDEAANGNKPNRLSKTSASESRQSQAFQVASKTLKDKTSEKNSFKRQNSNTTTNVKDYGDVPAEPKHKYLKTMTPTCKSSQSTPVKKVSPDIFEKIKSFKTKILSPSQSRQELEAGELLDDDIIRESVQRLNAAHGQSNGSDNEKDVEMKQSTDPGPWSSDLEEGQIVSDSGSDKSFKCKKSGHESDNLIKISLIRSRQYRERKRHNSFSSIDSDDCADDHDRSSSSIIHSESHRKITGLNNDSHLLEKSTSEGSEFSYKNFNESNSTSSSRLKGSRKRHHTVHAESPSFVRKSDNVQSYSNTGIGKDSRKRHHTVHDERLSSDEKKIRIEFEGIHRDTNGGHTVYKTGQLRSQPPSQLSIKTDYYDELSPEQPAFDILSPSHGSTSDELLSEEYHKLFGRKSSSSGTSERIPSKTKSSNQKVGLYLPRKKINKKVLLEDQAFLKQVKQKVQQMERSGPLYKVKKAPTCSWEQEIEDRQFLEHCKKMKEERSKPYI